MLRWYLVPQVPSAAWDGHPRACAPYRYVSGGHMWGETIQRKCFNRSAAREIWHTSKYKLIKALPIRNKWYTCQIKEGIVNSVDRRSVY